MDWLHDILQGDALRRRRAIAKTITLLESTRAEHRAQGDELLTALLPHTGRAMRLGISGVPGVGKSTFIEALGVFLIEKAALQHGGSLHPPQPQQRHAGRCGRKNARSHAGVRSGGL